MQWILVAPSFFIPSTLFWYIRDSRILSRRAFGPRVFQGISEVSNRPCDDGGSMILCDCLEKRSQALLRCNLARDLRACGAPMVPLAAHAGRSRFLAAIGHRTDTSIKSFFDVSVTSQSR